jgi:hypothetical protein
MNANDFRSVALALPEAEEKSHFGKADFRVRNRIFGSLPDESRAVLKFSPDEQAMLSAAEPGIFSPIKGGWGRQGWTQVDLSACDETTLHSACLVAWRNAAPARVKKTLPC